MKNKEWLSETISDMYEKQNTLHIGQTVKIGDNEESKTKKNTTNRLRAGIIIALYKDHFLVEFGKDTKYRESFSYIDIVTSITNYADVNNRGGEKLFNAKFKEGYKRITIEMIPFKINLENQILMPKKERKNKNKEIYRKWSAKKIKYIMENKDSVLRQELTDDFNLKFGTKVTRPQINAAIHREKERAKV